MSTDAKGKNANVNSNILMIRHGEKESDGINLDVAGQERAQAYVVYFQQYAIQGGPAGPVALNYLFASADSSHSDRPAETIASLAQALGLTPDESFADKDYTTLRDALLGDAKYANSNILICWHHGEILDFAKALGAHHSTLPVTSNWPKKWPGDVFGWVLQLCYDSDGDLDTSRTLCLNQKLMYDDHGQDPPGPDVAG